MDGGTLDRDVVERDRKGTRDDYRSVWGLFDGSNAVCVLTRVVSDRV